SNSAGLQKRRQLLAGIRAAYSKMDLDRCRKLVTKVNRLLDSPLPAVLDASFHEVIKERRAETHQLRKSAKKKLKATQMDRWEVNRKAAIHQMLNQERPSQVTSIVNPLTKQLEVQPEKLKSILRNGFSAVFDCPDEGIASAKPLPL